MPSQNARRLRLASTDAERAWSALRDRRLSQYKFRRHHPIAGFIVDFACTKYQLAIEIDGSQNANNTTDEARTAQLERLGRRVIRFWNNDVLANTSAVVETIVRALETG